MEGGGKRRKNIIFRCKSIGLLCCCILIRLSKEILINMLSKFFSEIAQTISFRADFYGLDSFPEAYFDRLQLEHEGGLRFEKRPLTEDERVQVDVDSISRTLSLTIEDIISDSCLIVSPIANDYFSYDVIIGHYFLYCQIRIKVFEKTIEQSNSVFQNLFDLDFYSKQLTLIQITCNSLSSVTLDSLKMSMAVFHPGVFCFFTPSVEKGRYVDVCNHDEETNVSIIRVYRRGINNQDGKTVYQFYVESIASAICSNNTIKEVIPKLLDTSLQYSSKCYKE